MISHLNKKNNPHIVDIVNKNKSIRTAKAEGIVSFDKSIYKKIESLKTKKGSIDKVAIIAGIMGAKETSRIIPLCHNIPINYVNLDIKKIPKKNSLKITSEIKTKSETGVEMEALVSVSICCLTIYDMCKYLDKSIIIKDIKLLSKTGGKNTYKVD